MSQINYPGVIKGNYRGISIFYRNGMYYPEFDLTMECTSMKQVIMLIDMEGQRLQLIDLFIKQAFALTPEPFTLYGDLPPIYKN